MTQTMIVVGGFGRAGTNTVTQYLHLHPEVFAYVSQVDRNDIIGQFHGNFENYINVQIPQTARFGGDRHAEIKGFFEEKNKDHNKGAVHILKKYRCITRKHELIEVNRKGLRFFDKIEPEVIYVFCVRANFHQLYASRVEQNTDFTVEGFQARMLASFKEMRRIAKRHTACCIDVTSPDIEDDYEFMDELIGIKPTDKMTWWRKKNPKTNATPEDTVSKRSFRLPTDVNTLLRTEYFETRGSMALVW